MAPGADVTEALHQGVHLLCAPRLRCILLQPNPKSRIEGFVLSSGDKPGLLDEVCVRTQSHVFHTKAVYTIIVHSTSRLIVVLAWLWHVHAGRGSCYHEYAGVGASPQERRCSMKIDRVLLPVDEQVRIEGKAAESLKNETVRYRL